MTKCYECGRGELKTAKVNYVYHGFKLGKFPAEVCPKCGEQFFSAESSDKIEKAAKKLGVWGLSMRTKVSQSGNSLDIRITKPIARFAGLTKGKEVIVHPEGKNRLVVEVL